MTLRLIGLADDHPVIMDALASKLAESGSFAVADLWQKFSLE